MSSDNPLQEAEQVPQRRRLQILKCKFCQKQYSKTEHLHRHERSHTGAKPFTCEICPKAFGRQDSLLRHLKTHRTASGSEDEIRIQSTSHKSQAQLESGVPLNGFGPSAMNTQSPASIGIWDPNMLSWPFDSTFESDALNSWGTPGQSLDSLMPDITGAQSSFAATDFAGIPSQINSGHETPSSILHNNSPNYYQQEQKEHSYESQVVEHLSHTINHQSNNLSLEVQAVGITADFLDLCLQSFFDRFIPIFPVIHQPTFVIQNCPHLLLLHMFAVGSLFVETDDAKSKGEVLWRLGHAFGFTSWQALLSHKGPEDARTGVGLLLGALLGQVYAHLSENKSLQKIAHSIHGLGFQWARESQMLEIGDQTPLCDPLLSLPEKTRSWRTWVALETQRRAVLGTYLLDSQIVFLSGTPTITCHLSNPLLQSCKESIFRASTLEEWTQEMQSHQQPPRSYRDIFTLLLSASSEWVNITLSPFSIYVLLSGLQSLVSKHNSAGGPPLGTPSRDNIHRALNLLYVHQICRLEAGSIQKMEVTLNWHLVSLDLAVDLAFLCSQLCCECGIEQCIYSGARKPVQSLVETGWASSSSGRIALLHAVSIRETAEKLPSTRLHAMHVPIALFAAATVFARCWISMEAEVQVPLVRDWKQLVEFFVEASDAEVVSSLSSGSCPGTNGSRIKKILYSLNALQMTMKPVALRWGICVEMGKVLDQWIKRPTEKTSAPS